MATRVLTSADLSLYKRLRLAALRTDPNAFASTYEREFQFDDATWLSRMSGFDGRAGVVLVDLPGIDAPSDKARRDTEEALTNEVDITIFVPVRMTDAPHATRRCSVSRPSRVEWHHR